MEKITTCILRFRDLVTDDGETIELHRAIIFSKGYVWWGWWKKGDEKTPGEFSRLNQKVKNGLVLYLLDSGLNKCYKANCTEIQFNNTSFNSPENGENTPEYYKKQKLFAWFKLTSITDCDTSELHEFTNIESNSLFNDKTINYSRFHSKRIASSKELIQQNRTVWFIRPFNAGDSEGEIVLLNSDHITPNNFSSKYYQAKGDAFLWLSDLHLADNVFPDRKSKSNNCNVKTLANHLCNLINNSEISVAGLLITGDITSRSLPDGFESAKDLIQDLRSENIDINSENTVICPGNHDFAWHKTELGKGKSPNYYKNGKYTKAYKEFYKYIYRTDPNEYFSCGRRFLLATGHIVEIVSFNSVLLNQYPNFEGNGLITTKQMELASKEMNWDKECPENVIRMVMMHHHYFPTCHNEAINPGRGNSAVYDAGELMEWLVAHNVKVLLHGHKHRSQISRIFYPMKNSNSFSAKELRPVIVAGMGGTAAPDNDNVFMAIMFSGNDIVFQQYKLYHDTIGRDELLGTIRLPIKE